MTSSLIERLKLDTLAARKANDEIRKGLLITLVAEAEKVGKDAGNRASTDDEVLATIRKFLKNAEQTAEVLRAGNRDTKATDAEIEVLQAYLPKQMTEQELERVVTDLVTALPERSPKAMGAVMAQLKAGHAGTYDGKMASEVIKRLLAA